MTWDPDTVDRFNEEGGYVQKTYVMRRHECDLCGEAAHFKITFLLNGDRSNPASAAFGKDDCTWCEDAHAFSCKKHRVAVQTREVPRGMKYSCTFPATERFKHLFLYQQEA